MSVKVSTTLMPQHILSTQIKCVINQQEILAMRVTGGEVGGIVWLVLWKCFGIEVGDRSIPWNEKTGS